MATVTGLAYFIDEIHVTGSGTAIADNGVLRGDGTGAIQGSALYISDAGVLSPVAASGTDQAGSALVINGGIGTGAASPAGWAVQMGQVGASSSTAQTQNQVLILEYTSSGHAKLRLLNKDGATMDGSEVSFRTTGASAIFPRTYIEGGRTSGDTNWAIRIAHKDSSSSVSIPSYLQLSTNKDTSYTNAETLFFITSTTAHAISTFTGSGSNGKPLYFGTHATPTSSVLFIDTVANNQRVGVGVGASPTAQFHVKSAATSLVGLIVDTQASHNTSVADLMINGTSAFKVVGSTGTPQVSFFNATPVSQQVSGADLTNNVTSGGTSDIIDNWSDLVVYANDAAAIRNAVYQLARKVKQINDGLRDFGLFT